MKRIERTFEIGRLKRAERVRRHSARRLERAEMIARAHHQRQRHSSLSHMLSPLRSTLLAAIGLSSLTACQVNEQAVLEGAGDEAGVMAGVMAGAEAGDEAGVMAGDEAGVMAGAEAGVMAGVMAGDEAGVMAGAEAGVMAGAEAGVMAGAEAGVMAGAEAGVMAGEEASVCPSPVEQVNADGEPNGYTLCEGDIMIKTGPANCLGASETLAGSCDVDADCDAGMLCLCQSTQGIPQCVSASCTSGDDCEIGCGVSRFSDGCEFTDSLTCFTEEDQCRGSAVCAETGAPYCYSPREGAAWQCSEVLCAVGRPLMEGGECHLAPITQGVGWVENSLSLPCKDLDHAELTSVINHWRTVMQLEHSSVASFARFTLQLMSLGAPADLLRATQLAAADEVRHAQRVAEILCSLTGESASLGSLPVELLSLTTDRFAILETLISEACLGETLGIAELTHAVNRCTEEVLKQILADILVDETRHAALAWRALRWIIESAPVEEQGSLIAWSREVFTREAKRRQLTDHTRQNTSPDRSIESLNRLGVLTASQRHEAHEVAYREVILPCCEQLFSLAKMSA